MKESVVIADFSVESEAYQALDEIKSDPVGENCVVLQGAILKKVNGRIQSSDEFSTDTADDTVKGSLIGTLVGILGGPLGVLFGGSVGALIGSNADINDAENQSSLLEKAGEGLTEGHTAVLLLVQEESEDVLDRELSKFHTSVTRLDAAEVAAEVEHAREVEQQVAADAKKKLHAQKTDEFKEKVSKKRAEIKEHFSRLNKHKDQKTED